MTFAGYRNDWKASLGLAIPVAGLVMIAAALLGGIEKTTFFLYYGAALALFTVFFLVMSADAFRTVLVAFLCLTLTATVGPFWAFFFAYVWSWFLPLDLSLFGFLVLAMIVAAAFWALILYKAGRA